MTIAKARFGRISAAGLFLYLAMLLLAGCEGKKEQTEFIPPLPYPSDDMARYIQGQVDSSEYLWYTDIKATASAYMNEFGFSPNGVSTSAIRIVGEGIFHGTVEVELPDEIVILTMERPFKQFGRRSIWQVTAMEEKPWPSKESK